MNSFCSTDCSQVTVTLVGEHILVRIGTLYTGSNSRSTAVGRFDHITVEVIVGKYGAANRTYTDGFALNAHFIQDFAKQSMYNTVGTARAVVHRRVAKCVGSFKYSSHFISRFSLTENPLLSLKFRGS